MKWHLLPYSHERVADQCVRTISLRSDVGAGVPLRCDVGAAGASTREVFWKEGVAVREEERGSAGHSSSDSTKSECDIESIIIQSCTVSEGVVCTKTAT